jgi:hypothetical protein
MLGMMFDRLKTRAGDSFACTFMTNVRIHGRPPRGANLSEHSGIPGSKISKLILRKDKVRVEELQVHRPLNGLFRCIWLPRSH